MKKITMICCQCGAVQGEGGAWAFPEPDWVAPPRELISHGLCDVCCAREFAETDEAMGRDPGTFPKAGRRFPRTPR